MIIATTMDNVIKFLTFLNRKLLRTKNIAFVNRVFTVLNAMLFLHPQNFQKNFYYFVLIDLIQAPKIELTEYKIAGKACVKCIANGIFIHSLGCEFFSDYEVCTKEEEKNPISKSLQKAQEVCGLEICLLTDKKEVIYS